MKACKNCKYATKDRMCMLSATGEISYWTGKPVPTHILPCKAMRSTGPCGKDATLFEQKDSLAPISTIFRWLFKRRN